MCVLWLILSTKYWTSTKTQAAGQSCGKFFILLFKAGRPTQNLDRTFWWQPT